MRASRTTADISAELSGTLRGSDAATRHGQSRVLRTSGAPRGIRGSGDEGGVTRWETSETNG